MKIETPKFGNVQSHHLATMPDLFQEHFSQDGRQGL